VRRLLEAVGDLHQARRLNPQVIDLDAPVLVVRLVQAILEDLSSIVPQPFGRRNALQALLVRRHVVR
jgi:hypothetical protein